MDEHVEAETREAKITKPTYVLFPKDWNARQIYEHLMARAEAIEETKNNIEGRSNSEKDRSDGRRRMGRDGHC